MCLHPSRFWSVYGCLQRIGCTHICRCGGIGRRKGLKILRRVISVPVRVRPPAFYKKTKTNGFSLFFDVVRLAAHVSNGWKSRIRPVAGRIQPKARVLQVTANLKEARCREHTNLRANLCLMTSPLIQEKLSHGLLFRLTLLRDIRKTYAPIMSDVPVRYIYMHQFFQPIFKVRLCTNFRHKSHSPALRLYVE